LFGAPSRRGANGRLCGDDNAHYSWFRDVDWETQLRKASGGTPIRTTQGRDQRKRFRSTFSQAFYQQTGAMETMQSTFVPYSGVPK
jgi:hypothetical protein